MKKQEEFDLTDEELELNNVIEFNLKGLTFINKNNIQKSTLQFI